MPDTEWKSVKTQKVSRLNFNREVITNVSDNKPNAQVSTIDEMRTYLTNRGITVRDNEPSTLPHSYNPPAGWIENTSFGDAIKERSYIEEYMNFRADQMRNRPIASGTVMITTPPTEARPNLTYYSVPYNNQPATADWNFESIAYVDYSGILRDILVKSVEPKTELLIKIDDMQYLGVNNTAAGLKLFNAGYISLVYNPNRFISVFYTQVDSINFDVVRFKSIKFEPKLHIFEENSFLTIDLLTELHVVGTLSLEEFKQLAIA